MHNWIVITLLGLLAVLCLLSMRFNSPTSDEQNHISRGYHYLVTGNLDLNVAPPFVNALSAVPLLLQRGITIPSYDVAHARTYINQFADEFVWVYNDAERIIYSGRLAIVVLSLLLGYFVFRWANELWGVHAGLLALFLYVLDPNIVAHSQLVTTDLGVACLIFIATYFLWRFLRQRRNLDLALAGIAVGLAEATKFSALLLLPIFAVILIIEAFVIRDRKLLGSWPRRARFDRRQWRRAICFICVVLFVLGLFSFLSFWASYRFETRPLSTPKA
ncbi:MAG: glycosyltransferase family 39 protein, partial [Anaerolineales bacterium]